MKNSHEPVETINKSSPSRSDNASSQDVTVKRSQSNDLSVSSETQHEDVTPMGNDDVTESPQANRSSDESHKVVVCRLILPDDDQESDDDELDTIFNQSGQNLPSPLKLSPSALNVGGGTGVDKLVGGPAKTKSTHSGRRKIRAAIFPSPRVAAAPPDSSEDVSHQTPSPSSFLWHPVKPGYYLPSPQERDRSIVISRTVQIQPSAQQHNTLQPPKDSETGLKKAIPEMPMFLAIVCLIFNVLLPGFGKMDLYE